MIKPLSVQRNKTGAVELAWTILDFRKGQDVRLKLGYELNHKVTNQPLEFLVKIYPVIVFTVGCLRTVFLKGKKNLVSAGALFSAQGKQLDP
jgi:hypothetical protein